MMSSSDEIPESGPTPRSTQRFTSASADLERRFLSSKPAAVRLKMIRLRDSTRLTLRLTRGSPLGKEVQIGMGSNLGSFRVTPKRRASVWVRIWDLAKPSQQGEYQLTRTVEPNYDHKKINIMQIDTLS